MKQISASTLIVLFALFSVVTASADFLLRPLPAASSQYSGKRSPFLFTSDFFPDDRLQQVFGAADFRDAGAPLRITELSFAAYDRPIDVTLPNIAIHVSTT